jgi:hypothetical protein
MRWLVVFGLLLAACSTTGPSVENPNTALERRNIGKSYWSNGVLHACQKSEISGADCEFVKKNEKIFTVDIVPDAAVPSYKDMKYIYGGDAKIAYTLESLFYGAVVDADPMKAEAECKRRGSPRIGMSAKQVEATCWGKLDHLNRTETAGVITDQYVYESGAYVYLRDGIVTAIQTSGTLR